MRRLTIKQKAFIIETVKTRNPTKAAEKVYDVKNNNVARNIASTNLAKPNIREGIEKQLQLAGYSSQDSIKRIMASAEAGTGIKATADTQLRADELLLKLSGHLIEKKQSYNVSMNIDNMENDQVIRVREKFNKIRSNRRTPQT